MQGISLFGEPAGAEEDEFLRLQVGNLVLENFRHKYLQLYPCIVFLFISELRHELHYFLPQTIHNEREIESLRNKLTFNLDAKEKLERYSSISLFEVTLSGDQNQQ
jgi:hypothetical protein